MWKDKVLRLCACPLIYIQDKLLLSLLFQSHKAQETQKLVLVRESSGSGCDAAGSVMEEDLMAVLDSQLHIMFIFFQFGDYLKNVETYPHFLFCPTFDDSLLCMQKLMES